eukprot:7489823-Alexandrium_andersonii.AAC.1
MGPVVTPSGPEGAGEGTRPRGRPRRSLRPLPLGTARPPLGQRPRRGAPGVWPRGRRPLAVAN